MKKPKIPMSPDQLPQQRVYEVLALPVRPEPFDFVTGYGDLPIGSVCEGHPQNAEYLCQVEWSWSPGHSRIDAYYLNKGRSHWSLWSNWWDDNWAKWDWTALACVPKAQANKHQAAVYLLLEFWQFDKDESELDRFHWINSSEFLSTAEIQAIGNQVWGVS